MICLSPKADPDESPRQLVALNFTASERSASASSVERIFETFEEQGAESALKVYSELRAAGDLNQDARFQLIESAREAGLSEILRRLVDDAVTDFPNSVRLRRFQSSLVDPVDNTLVK